jgi:hypothetical protein
MQQLPGGYLFIWMVGGNSELRFPLQYPQLLLVNDVELCWLMGMLADVHQACPQALRWRGWVGGGMVLYSARLECSRVRRCGAVF